MEEGGDSASEFVSGDSSCTTIFDDELVSGFKGISLCSTPTQAISVNPVTKMREVALFIIAALSKKLLLFFRRREGLPSSNFVAGVLAII